MHDAVPLLHDFLAHSARRLPDKVALVCARRRITYREFDESSNALAHALIELGVARGDRVLIFASNTVETAVSFWAVLKAGAVASVVNPATKGEKLAFLIKDCRPAALITEARLHEVWGVPAAAVRTVIVCGDTGPNSAGTVQWNRALAMGDPERCPTRRSIDIDLAAIIYTSGSTGEPKGVMLTHRNMLTAAASVSGYLEIAEDDVVLNVLPFSFNYGLYQMIMSVRQGARLVLENAFAFPAQVLRLMVEEAVTAFPGVPTIFAILAEMQSAREHDLSRVRLVTNTAAPLPQKHIAALREIFPSARIYSMYGLTECKRCTYLPPEDLERKPGSVGIPIPNTELWIVDEHGRKLPPDTPGQLVIRGATVMQGYWEKPEATAAVLKPGPLPGERVLYTGDCCRLDEEGYLYFIGRLDDIIKTRGEKVAPAEVERVLFDIDGVKEAAVVGVPDPILGEAVKAFVVLEKGARLTEKKIQARCQQKLEPYAVPKYVEFRSELPKTSTGKITKNGLRVAA
ncbi:MAG TPA: class I adenylate-forming enzyme family protein [Burkholderiales bacterium]|nr:class I adenylate-forming enzyme family protein [Burkholderiales bacterium]